MSFELEIITPHGSERPSPVTPKGVFSLNLRREEYRFREELEGAMTFYGDDFYLITQRPEGTFFKIWCDFKGKMWRGHFTLMDCDVNYSKSYLEVTPTPDDDYREFLPYMGVDMNILQDKELPPGVIEDIHTSRLLTADVALRSIRWYETEVRREVISEPYTGPGSDDWNGYSVNDWIFPFGGDPQNYYFYQFRNSLIYKLGVIEGTNNASYLNDWSPFGDLYGLHHVYQQLLWLDHYGYTRMSTGSTTLNHLDTYKQIRDAHMQPSMFTLTEVVNYYDHNQKWSRAELIYKRDIWRGQAEPKSGQIAEEFTDEYYGEVISYLGGWFYHREEKMWVRRPLGMMESIQEIVSAFWSGTDPSDGDHITKYLGDGTWFTPLSDFVKTKEGYTRTQELAFNRYERDYHNQPSDWYSKVYGRLFQRSKRRLYKIPTLIKKFLVHIKEQGGGYFPLKSDYLQDETDPITGSGDNEWYHTAIVHNSDLKRPESTEKATLHEMSFEDFLDAICGIMNAGWAIIDGEFVLEHKSFFDNGLTYDKEINPDCEEDCNWINPASIYNFQQNKHFLKMSERFTYERADMQKYEVFETEHGREPEYNNMRITYSSPWVNNRPDENKREISIGLSIDPEFIIDEAPDEGITLLYGDVEGVETPPVWYLWGEWGLDTFPILIPSKTYLFHWPIYETDNEGEWDHGVHRRNPYFTLRHILNAFHDYGRSFKEGSIGEEEERGLVSRHFIRQNLFFPPVKYEGLVPERFEVNPYTRIMTIMQEDDEDVIRLGRIEEGSFSTRQGILDLEVGYFEAKDSDYNNDYGGSFAPITDPRKTFRLCFYRHIQDQPSSTWNVFHSLKTRHPFRPIVYVKDEETGDMHEIGYKELKSVSGDYTQIRFTVPVSGEAYFLSIGCPASSEDEDTDIDDFTYLYQGVGDEWVISHGLGTTEVARSIIIDKEGNEIRESSYEVVDANTIKITFTRPVSGDILLGTFLGAWEKSISGSEVSISQTHNYPLKPIILSGNFEVGYNYNRLEDSLIKIGFTRSVIGTIYLKQYD